ncbi:hypothetical protein [Mycobacterium sp.]
MPRTRDELVREGPPPLIPGTTPAAVSFDHDAYDEAITGAV